jgi:amino acid transporter
MSLTTDPVPAGTRRRARTTDHRPRESSGSTADREQLHAALLSLMSTLVIAMVLYTALVDVDATIEKVILATMVSSIVLGVAAFVHRAATPTRRLPHPAKVRREQRHAAMLNGVLFATLLLLVYTAAFDLNSWAEWTVFGVIVVTAAGAGIAVQSRLR